MKKILFLLLISLSSFMKLSNANEAVFIALSDNVVELNANFKGKEILLFGAKNQPGDLFIIFRGPEVSYTTRKKERVFGFWSNNDFLEFKNMPSFYFINGTNTIDYIENENLLKNLEIGLDNLAYSYGGSVSIDKVPEFKFALMESLFEKKLFMQDIGKIEFLGDTFFKSKIFVPKHIKKGIYTIETYLIDQNKIKAIHINPLEVKKVGFESFVYNLAHENKVSYGLIAVFSALLFGWIASHIFWRG